MHGCGWDLVIVIHVYAYISKLKPMWYTIVVFKNIWPIFGKVGGRGDKDGLDLTNHTIITMTYIIPDLNQNIGYNNKFKYLIKYLNINHDNDYIFQNIANNVAL